jgi:hypothetical protein
MAWRNIITYMTRVSDIFMRHYNLRRINIAAWGGPEPYFSNLLDERYEALVRFPGQHAATFRSARRTMQRARHDPTVVLQGRDCIVEESWVAR